MHGVGRSKVYFIDRWREFSIYDVDFVPIPTVAAEVPALERMHWFGVVQYVGLERAADWCAFYGSLFGFTGGVLHEGDFQHLSLKVNANSVGLIDAMLTFTTDQNAPLGGSGQSFQFNLAGFIQGQPNDVPEPGSVALLLSALLGFGLNQFWRRRRTAGK